MFESVGAFSRRCFVSAFSVLACSASVLVGTAAAQSTIVLNQAGNQVTDTTIRSGAYSNTNFDNYPLITRRSTSDPDWERRALLKFNTDTYVPAGAQITRAKPDAHGESPGSECRPEQDAEGLPRGRRRSWNPTRPG